jgi:hopanoid biosynthesis associated radical SAM protein HpnH
MSVPVAQQLRIGRYVVGQALRGRRRYPLVLMLEPLYRCNLACPGCGKIAQSEAVLARRLSPEECLAAVDECGAPVVSVAGGEPLLHPQMPAIVAAILARGKFVYLCTNGLLLRRALPRYAPSPRFSFSVHLDGARAEHDAAVARAGVFDRAVAAVRAALARGHRVTVNCTVYQDRDPADIAAFFDFVTALGVEGITVAPAYRYDRARRQDIFLARREIVRLFRRLFDLGRGRRWPLLHSALYLDFLAGRRDYACTPWGNPTRSPLGWQRPCYLIGDGYAPSFRALMEETCWERYGTGNHPSCADCMAHCGYEASAVLDAVRHPWRALGAARRGARRNGAHGAPDAGEMAGRPQ